MLQILTPFIAMLAAILVRTDRRIVEELMAAHAASPEDAIPLKNSPMRTLRIKRLLHAGALYGVSGGRYYLDLGGWTQYRRRRRARVLTVASIVLGFALFALLFRVI